MLRLWLGLVTWFAQDFPTWSEWNWMLGTRRVATACNKNQLY